MIPSLSGRLNLPLMFKSVDSSGSRGIVKVNDVVIIAVPDVPGALAGVLEQMAEAKIDIEYMYSLFNRGKEDAYMVFRVNDEDLLIALLKKNGVRIISAAEIGLA